LGDIYIVISACFNKLHKRRMNIEAITQESQTIAVHKEIESSRLMEAKELEDIDTIKHIDEIQEFNAILDAEVMINQGGFFDLYV
jgi:hypothetical protein